MKRLIKDEEQFFRSLATSINFMYYESIDDGTPSSEEPLIEESPVGI